MPGDNLTIDVVLLKCNCIKWLRFAIREGRTVGAGQVTEIVA
jgi:translation elongation factor EF-Tu-like GTPase